VDRNANAEELLFANAFCQPPLSSPRVEEGEETGDSGTRPALQMRMNESFRGMAWLGIIYGTPQNLMGYESMNIL
jgi:hypothetical protein